MPILVTEDGYALVTEDGLFALGTEDALVDGCMFTPPTELTVPPVEEDAPPLANRLFRWYGSRPCGRAVWHLMDDTFTFTQPYPYFDNSANTATAQGADNDVVATFKAEYLGGHNYVVSDDECALLTAFLTAEGYTPSDWIAHAGDGLP